MLRLPVNDILAILAILAPSVVAIAVTIATLLINRRDKLVDKVSELSERISRIEGILTVLHTPTPTRARTSPTGSDEELRIVKENK